VYTAYVTHGAALECASATRLERRELAAQGCGKSEYVGTLGCRTVTS